MPETVVSKELIIDNCEVTKCKAKGDEEQQIDGEASISAADASTKDSPAAATYDLNKFQLQRVLNNNTRSKSIALLGSFPHVSDSDSAIVIFEKQAFQEADVATSKPEAAENDGEANGKHSKDDATESEECSYFGNDLKVQTEFINNIYGSYQCTPPSKLSGIKATVVYPATDKHIEKYSICGKYVINETPDFYKNITLPYITSSQFTLEWVYNILEHNKESERIIFEDPDPEMGFILLPDLKWDARNAENLYVLVITHKRDIKSIRDLNATHLPLLRNIRRRAAEEIEKQYGLVGSQLRMYFHYQPSFYHLHIHINLVRNEAPGIWCEKSHMLDTVINNIELLPNYYELASLPFVVYEGNKLLELYEEKMPIKRKETTKRCLEVEEGESKCKKQKIEVEEITKTPEESKAVKE